MKDQAAILGVSAVNTAPGMTQGANGVVKSPDFAQNMEILDSV
jgi:hypothetical protein